MPARHNVRASRKAVLRRWPLALLVVPAAPAQAQSLPPPLVEDRARALDCMTLAIAYEAGYEVIEGRAAVAEVILNRVRDPRFPKSVCGVVFAGSTRRTGCQFTFTCDGSLRRPLPAAVLLSARSVAEQALDGLAPPRVAGATHYHADYVSPYWAPSLVRTAKIGAHIFYRSAGARAAVPGGALPAPAPPAAISPRPEPAPPFAPWGLRVDAPSPAPAQTDAAHS